ncbi:MAG: hypothetical protein O3B68_08705 [Planctomycetota bacterium]|nr:hypothetical protein [Planctomycetota bacterium]
MATPSRRDLAVEKFNATPQESATRGSEAAYRSCCAMRRNRVALTLQLVL